MKGILKFFIISLIILGVTLFLIPTSYFLFHIFFKKPTSLPSQNPPQVLPTPPIEKATTTQSFNEIIPQLNTSQKLIDYLNENFKLEETEQEKPKTPEQFFEDKKGTQWDFAIFTSYILWKNKYDAAIIRYKYDSGKINVVVVFRDTDLPKTIIFTPEGVLSYPHGWSFDEMFQKEEERLGIQIKEYAVSYWTDKGELWPEEWTKREF